MRSGLATPQLPSPRCALSSAGCAWGTRGLGANEVVAAGGVCLPAAGSHQGTGAHLRWDLGVASVGSHSAHAFLSLLERHSPALAEGALALPEAQGLFWGTWAFCTSSSQGPFTWDWLSASQVRRREPPTCADALHA